MTSLTEISFTTRSKCLLNEIKKMSGTQNKKLCKIYYFKMVSSPSRNLRPQLYFTILDLIVMFIVLIFIDWRQEAAISGTHRFEYFWPPNRYIEVSSI